MTNGEKFIETFPNMRITLMLSYVQVMGENYEFNNAYPYTWWNAEYKEPRKGHWIEVLGGCKCSCCDMAFSRLKETCADNYCPNCGSYYGGASNGNE